MGLVCVPAAQPKRKRKTERMQATAAERVVNVAHQAAMLCNGRDGLIMMSNEDILSASVVDGVDSGQSAQRLVHPSVHIQE